MTDEAKYPRFIQNKPCGIDKFEGKSQKRLTEAIANYISSTDKFGNSQQMSRIIGLEGIWGSGKSNVIKQLKEELKENYYLFEYDAWGHQEDLQRRSFLELLTADLIKNAEILDKKTWEPRLNNLLAKKIVRYNRKIPKFNAGALWTVIVFGASHITTYFSRLLENICEIKSIWLLMLISYSPIIIGVILWFLLMIKNKEMRSPSYLLQISKNENIKTKNYETINEDEPTAQKFRNWMQSISDHISNNKNKKLIIVFDNMDRLPAEKVKNLWSSIHTFFSEDGFDNIWAIIPFDEKHIACAFGENGNNINLTKGFISKTFPVIYRVTPPVITDFKKIFFTLFEEAFSNTENKNQEDINRIFKLVKPDATVRDMIIFINQLVSLKTIWKEEIDIIYMAVFILKKDELLTDTVNLILSGKYLEGFIGKIIPNDEDLQKNISALIYGISPDDAEQIPISKYIESSLNIDDGYDINKYTKHKHFLSVLKDKIIDSDILLDTLIKGLANINNEYENNNKEIFINFWNTIAKQKMELQIPKQEFDDSFKALIIHTDEEYQQKIIRYLCFEFQNFKDFKGDFYYSSIDNLNKFINENKIVNKINEYINDIEINPIIFIDYVSVAKVNYKLYKLYTNPEKLDDYVMNLLPDDFENINVIKSLTKNDAYKFINTLNKIEKLIKDDIQLQIINSENFKLILDLYKILSDKKPLPVQFNTNQRNTIWNSLSTKTDKKEYLEILSIQLANGAYYGVILNNTQIEILAKNMDFFANYGDLLLNNLSWGNVDLSKILKYMTENKIGQIMSIEEVLPKFFDIINNITLTEEVFLNQLDRWNKFISSINKDNIQKIIPKAKFFQHSVLVKNTLTDYLNKTIIEALSEVSNEVLYQQMANSNNYWFEVINNLIETEYIKIIPENINEYGRRLLDEIASKKRNIPNHDDIYQKIINKLDNRKISAQIIEIRNKFCNDVYKIDANIFKYFESWLRKQGDLINRNTEVLHTIIEPVLNNPECLNIIIKNSEFYINLINSAGDEAINICEQINKKLENSEDEELIKFVKRIIHK